MTQVQFFLWNSLTEKPSCIWDAWNGRYYLPTFYAYPFFNRLFELQDWRNTPANKTLLFSPFLQTFFSKFYTKRENKSARSVFLKILQHTSTETKLQKMWSFFTDCIYKPEYCRRVEFTMEKFVINLAVYQESCFLL